MALKVGIQLFSVRNAMEKDPLDTIAKVADIGYKYIEVSNHNAKEDYGVGFPVDLDELKAVLKQYDASIFSSIIFPINLDNVRPVLAWHQKIGSHYLINPAVFARDKKETLAICDEFNEVGRICQEEGLGFCYHNHYHEFVKMDGDKTMMDLIIENTDPKYVGIELDTYWALRGGQDPARLIKGYGSRVKLLHQKDLVKDLSEPVNILEKIPEGTYIDLEKFSQYFDPETVIEVGTGSMDIQAMIDAATEVGSAEAIFLEQDYTKLTEMESVQVSMDNFRKFKGIAW